MSASNWQQYRDLSLEERNAPYVRFAARCCYRRGRSLEFALAQIQRTYGHLQYVRDLVTATYSQEGAR